MLAPGSRLGPYEIGRLIGAGGMGEVYRARDLRLERDVALKIISPHRAGDPDAVTRFEHEAR
ncbi:MAG TPA: serine/threonine protein kinase, partial [Vicinamibacterales bacterium]